MNSDRALREMLELALKEVGVHSFNSQTAGGHWTVASLVSDLLPLLGPIIGTLANDKLEAEVCQLRGAIRRAEYAVMQTSGEWRIFDVSERGKELDRQTMEVANKNLKLEMENTRLAKLVDEKSQIIDQQYLAMRERQRMMEGYIDQHEVDQSEIRRWRDLMERHNAWMNKGYWAWQGDGEDHLESLVCPIMITPQQLRAELAKVPVSWQYGGVWLVGPNRGCGEYVLVNDKAAGDLNCGG